MAHTQQHILLDAVILSFCLSFFFIVAQGDNLALNPSFESGSTSWTAYGNGFSIDSTTAQSGTSSLFCNTSTTTATKGAYQVVTLNQATAASVTVSAYARASAALTGTGSFALYTDIQLMNGTWVYGVQVGFTGTTTTWEAKSFATSPGPIATMWVYCLFRNIQGNVWFDNVYVGPTTGAPTVAPTPATTSSTASTTTSKSTTQTTTGGTGSATTGSTSSTTGSAPTPAPTPAPTSAPTPASTYYTLGLKYLIIAPAAGDIRLLAAQRTFDAVGAQYDYVLISEVVGNFSLMNTDGSGKYLGFVYALDTLTLTATQQTQLVQYQAQFHIKSVTLYTYPYAANGVALATVGASANLGNLTFASAASGFISGYNPNAMITNDAVYTYPATITDATIAQPAIYITYPSAPTTKYVAAAFVTLNNTTRQLQFFLDQASWCVHTTALGMFWLQWMSNNLYLGLRRTFLNCQVDDLFMDSDEWDTVTVSEPELYSYRITADELQAFSDWQVTTNAKLPAGSNITIAFPFNGATVADYGGITKDTLYLKAKSLINSFTFMTHTFDHPELDNLTYAQVKKELTDNFVITLQLFGSYNHARYSNTSMVTPSISGIFNGNALRALWDCGIRHIVGDNSRVELQTPFAYHGMYTTVATNGFAGMYIVPREATSMFYDNTLPAETISEYNHMYNATLGPSTFDQILDRESTRVANLLLAFRYDPYMFHQANIRGFSYNGKTTSLLAHWVDSVLAKYTQYYNLPVISHKQDLISQKWLDRESRDACGFSGTVKVATATNKIVSIGGITTNSCQMAITGASVTASATVSSETYGPDTTVWVTTTANKAFTLTLNTQIQM